MRMLDSKLIELMNFQVNREFYSAYLYLQFANFFSEMGLDGFANWYTIQAQEERDHAMLFVQYLQRNDGKVVFEGIEAPDNSHASAKDVLKAGLAHEQLVTGYINAIYAAADTVHDYRTMQFLDWFVKEQSEEEMNAADLIKKYALFGDDAKGLYLLNQELGTRVYTAPSLVL